MNFPNIKSLTISQDKLLSWSPWMYHILLIILTLAIAFSMFVWTDPGFLVDDATITYRYSLNIANGHGFVYNLGEPVQGTSTPLFTLIIAAINLLGISPIVSGHAVGIVSALLSIVMIFIIGNSVAGWKAGFGASLLSATSAHFAANVSSGMETPFYVLLILITFWLYYEKHYLLAAFVSGLCVITRLDGFTVVAALLLSLTIFKRAIPWKETAIILLAILPWFIFAKIYFGSFLPLSMLAKQQHIKSAGSFWMIRFLINTPFEMLLIPILIFLGTVLSRSKQTVIKTFPLIIWLILYITAYTLIDIDAYDWYLVPLIPIVYIIFSVAVVEIVGRLGFSKEQYFTLIVIFVFLFGVVYQVKYDLSLVPEFKKKAVAVEGTRVQVGEWLRENTSPDSIIATDGIGHIGYYSDRYIVDLLGLVTPVAVGQEYIDTLNYFEADYAISVIKEDAGHPFKSEDFLDKYEFVYEWDGSKDYVGSHVLFKRRID
jgi:hypothetical protein